MEAFNHKRDACGSKGLLHKTAYFMSELEIFNIFIANLSHIMKYRLLLLMALLHQTLFAQVKTNLIYDSWVSTHITYKDGAELPNDIIVKYTYTKYTFTLPGKINISFAYNEKGTQNVFEIAGNLLTLKTEAGWVMNMMRIEELTLEKLVLLQSGVNGFDDPSAFKFEFRREVDYQTALPLTINDIYRINGNDTVYMEGPKIYAAFQGDSFHDFLKENMGSNSGDKKSGRILTSFVVSEKGVADSLKILEGLDAQYDKAYIRAFYKAKNKWNAAQLNGKKVKVRMMDETRYFTSDMMIPAYNYTRDADAAFKEKKYELALYYFDKALNKLPIGKENLYKRGICKQMLGNQPGACEDWQAVKKLGGSTVDALLVKYCK